MESQVRTIDDGNVELTVQLSRPELQEHITRVERQALSELEIDGFRKGKVPDQVGRQHLDQSKVMEVALQAALETSLSGVIAEHQFDVFQTSDLKIQENSPEKLKYSVVLTLFPAVTLPDLGQVQVQRRAVETTDQEVADTLEVIRDSRATFASKDTPAQTGDRVEVDFEVRQNGIVIEGGVSKNHPLIIGGKNFIPGFEDELIGMKKSETKTFSLTAPSDYYQQAIAGKKLDFTVTMNNVQSVNKPELTDAFAQTLGAFTGLDQLKTGVRQGIAEEKRQKEQQRVRLAALDRIIEKTEIKVSGVFVEGQLNALIANFERDLNERGMELGMYLAQMKKTRDDLRKEWRKEAERQAKITVIIHAVAKAHDLAATSEEVAQMLNENIQQLVARGGVDPSQIDLAAARHAISDQITSEKALTYIETACVKG